MVTINIDENLIDFVTERASNDAVTVEVWCERKLNANIKQIRREKLFDTIKSDIETYEPVVLAKKEEIKQIQINEKIAYDLANPVIEKEQATSTEEVIK